MLLASLYITLCSARNRIRLRLRRLREPRYLVGAIAGAAYLYFTVFARMWGRRASSVPRRGRQQPPPDVQVSAFLAAGPAVVGLGLLVMTTMTWLLPSSESILTFTEAETQFLFPAPVTRRQLLVHRLLRSQLGILFAAIVPALFLPSGSAFGRTRIALAMWVILMTVRVHATGVSLARASLTMPGAEAKRRQWWPPLVLLTALVIVGVTAVRVVSSHTVADFWDGLNILGEISNVGASHVVLWPFMALARPLFSPWPGPFLTAMAFALAVLAANVVWVLQSDASFQEAAAQADAQRAKKLARARPAVRARDAGWTLAPTGRPELLFIWKGVTQMVRETSIVSFLRYGAPVIALAISAASIYTRTAHMRGLSAMAGGMAAGASALTVLLGPQMVRTDLRQDLLHLEVLKTWPVNAAALVRGEMLWPATVLTAIAWSAIACATMLWTSAFPVSMLPWRLSAGLAAALLAPALVLAQLTIHNAAALLFPAWVPLGSARPRGVDAMGQRLIMFAGVLLGLIAMALPGAIAGGILWFAFRRILGSFALALGAAACSATVLFEVLVATEALGPAYDRLDLTAVERAE